MRRNKMSSLLAAGVQSIISILPVSTKPHVDNSLNDLPPDEYFTVPFIARRANMPATCFERL